MEHRLKDKFRIAKSRRVGRRTMLGRRTSAEFQRTISADTHAYHNFAGKIGRTMVQSKPDWPSRPEAPAGAPNIVIILCDDVGYSDFGCFGSEIPTPNIDRLAERGAALHQFPRDADVLADEGGTSYRQKLACRRSWLGGPRRSGLSRAMPWNFRRTSRRSPKRCGPQGYATYMVGKWHLCKDFDHTETASRASWPVQRGFDRFYGFLEAFSNYHHPPTLMVDNSEVAPERYPDGYYLTDDLTDRAVSMIRSSKASDSSKPVFLYFAHPAVHAPLHAKSRGYRTASRQL